MGSGGELGGVLVLRLCPQRGQRGADLPAIQFPEQTLNGYIVSISSCPEEPHSNRQVGSAPGDSNLNQCSRLPVDLNSLTVDNLAAVKKQLDEELEHLTNSFTKLRQAQSKFRECITSVKKGVHEAQAGMRQSLQQVEGVGED